MWTPCGRLAKNDTRTVLEVIVVLIVRDTSDMHGRHTVQC